MAALSLFASTFALVFFLGLQSLNVNRGRYLAAFVTSICIGLSQLVLFKLAPDATGLEITAFVAGGPFGIVTGMWVHQRMTGWRI